MDNSTLISHYQKLLSDHGDDAKALQHFDQKSQLKRFEVLSSYIPQESFTALDIGCGLGHLQTYLAETKKNFHYHGADIVPEFITMCRKKFSGNSNVSFSQTDLLENNEGLAKSYDYVIICGIFNNKVDDNWGFLTSMITKAFALTTHTLSFNLLSTYVDHQAKELYYVDPCVVFDYCKKNLSRKVTLRHDYIVKEGSIPYEYTIHVTK